MLAIKNGFEDIALDICAKGADISIAGSDEIPPLIAAASQGYIRLIREFIKKGMLACYFVTIWLLSYKHVSS